MSDKAFTFSEEELALIAEAFYEHFCAEPDSPLRAGDAGEDWVDPVLYERVKKLAQALGAIK